MKELISVHLGPVCVRFGQSNLVGRTSLGDEAIFIGVDVFRRTKLGQRLVTSLSSILIKAHAEMAITTKDVDREPS